MVDYITEIKNSRILNKKLRLQKMLNEAKLLNFARLATILIEVYGFEKPFRKVGKREGQEIEFYFPSIKGYITFILVKNKFDFKPRVERAKNPVSTATIYVKREEIVPLMSELVRMKSNNFALLKIFIKYIIPKKVKITGNYLSFICLFRCLAIGKQDMFNNKR